MEYPNAYMYAWVYGYIVILLDGDWSICVEIQHPFTIH